MNLTGKHSSALFGLVAFCFFLPFVTFSCAGGEMHLSGMDTAFGATIETPTVFGQKREVTKAEGDTSAKIALACAAVGIFLGLTNFKQVYPVSIAAAGLGAICLFVLKSRVEKEVLREGGGLVQISFDAGFWLALLGFAAAVALNAYLLSRSKNLPETSGLSAGVGVPAIGLVDGGTAARERMNDGRDPR